MDDTLQAVDAVGEGDLRKEERQRASGFLTVEMIEELDLPENLPPYQGGGATSFHSKYDVDKLDYLLQIGVTVPLDIANANEVVVHDRARFVATFIVTGMLLSLVDIRDAGGDLGVIVPGFDRKLCNERVNGYTDRVSVVDSRRVEDFVRARGFSCNPGQKVTVEELHEIVQFVHDQLLE